MKSVQLHSVLTMMLLALVKAQKKQFDTKHFCEKLGLSKHDHNISIQLQSLTLNSISNELWMIESGMLYRIPAANLDTTTDRLLLYSSGQRLMPMTINTAVPAMSVIRTSDIVSMSIVSQHYYFVQAIDTYYVFQDDGGNWCDSYDDKLMPWQLTAMKHPTKPDSGELWVGLKQMREATPASRRVIFTPLEMKHVRSYQNSESDSGGVVTCNIVEFNFPGEDMGDFKPVQPRGSHVHLETVDDRSRAAFVPSGSTSRTNYKMDLFALPPIVLVSQNKLYMLSLELERVYVMDAVELTEALEQKVQKDFKVRSLSWTSFFSCGPWSARSVPSVEPEELPLHPKIPPDDREPTQAEYLEIIGELYSEEPFRWDWWLEDYAEELIVAGLIILILVTFFLVALNRGWLPYIVVKCFCCGNDQRARAYTNRVKARRYPQSQKPSGCSRDVRSTVINDSERKFQSEGKRMLQIDVGNSGLPAWSKETKETNRSSSNNTKRLEHKSKSDSSDSLTSQSSDSKKTKMPSKEVNLAKQNTEPEKSKTSKAKKLNSQELIMRMRTLAESAAKPTSSSASPNSPASNSPSK